MPENDLSNCQYVKNCQIKKEQVKDLIIYLLYYIVHQINYICSILRKSYIVFTDIFLIISSISGHYAKRDTCITMWRSNRYLIWSKTMLTARLSRHDDPLRASRSPSVGSLMTIRRATPRLALPVQIALPSELLPLAFPCNLSKLQHYDTRD